MKYFYIDLLVLSFLHPGTMGHYLTGDRVPLVQGKSNLRGRSVGKMMVREYRIYTLAILCFMYLSTELMFHNY